MAHYLAELYSPTAQWLALPQPERQQYFAKIGAGMPALTELGVEVLALGETSLCIHGASQKFFALWRLPNAEITHILMSAIADTGWHDYFETINAVGAGVDFPAHLQQLAAA